VLFDLANGVNRFIEQTKLEEQRTEPDLGAAVAATQILMGMGRLLGLFLVQPATRDVDNDLIARVLQAHIVVRAFCRQEKLFQLADYVRDQLAALTIALEDRSDKTSWTASRALDEATLDRLVRILIEVRQKSREAKNFAVADRVRDELRTAGITLEDKAGSTHWQVAV
jgi:cysteinyl-tRNA synthetase